MKRLMFILLVAVMFGCIGCQSQNNLRKTPRSFHVPENHWGLISSNSEIGEKSIYDFGNGKWISVKSESCSSTGSYSANLGWHLIDPLPAGDYYVFLKDARCSIVNVDTGVIDLVWGDGWYLNGN